MILHSFAAAAKTLMSSLLLLSPEWKHGSGYTAFH